MSILCCQKVFTGIYKCATRLLNMDLTSTPLLNNENCNICARKRPLHWLHSVSFVQFPWPLLAINCILTNYFIYSTAYTAYTHTWYLSFFLHGQRFWRIKFTPKKRVNYDKIHSKLPIFCIITAKYTVNCQFLALNL